MTEGVRLVMLGRQGAGKGTQAIRLAQHFVVPHISTGDMLRAAVAAGTEFGLRAKSVMDDGGLVGDDIMIGVVDERLNESDTTKRGYILDGFPRTVPQGESLEAITKARPLDLVVDLEVPEDVVLERITKRRVCKTCGHIYSVDSPPKNGWICDVDGGEVVQRADDTEEAVRKRLDLYAAETKPLVPFYADRDLLVEVDGLGSTDEVFARLLKAVESRRGA
ncbi:adenylate kinase [Aquihabitans daechungensis]|uniref:adenylate kinase n=1 Tax=Aquihabitans daechungensis TaxID=1052257 RepID=UPI003B9F3F95